MAVSNAVNKLAQTDESYKDWSCRLVHTSGFINYLNPAIQDILGPADIITVQRNIVTEEVINAIKYWQGLGKPVVADLDDAYTILPWANPAHTFWIDDPHAIDPLATLERGLQTCGYLTSPNRLILQDWAHVARGYYLPNYAQGEWWTDLEDRATMQAKSNWQDRIVIGWGGSVSHYDSWWGSGIFEAAKHITKHYPEVLWLICGNDPRLYSQLPVHRDNKHWQHGVEPSQWPQIIKTFDIGVAPLYGPYDQRRSWIKTLEYGLAGVPWVATEGEPYRDHTGLGTLIKNDPLTWERGIEQLIANLPTAQDLAAQRVELYRQWLIEQQVATYGKVFGQIQQDFTLDHTRLPNIHRVSARAEAA